MFGLFLFAAEKRYESVLVFHDSNDEQQTEYQLCDKSDKLKGVCGVTSGEAIDVGCNRENESDDAEDDAALDLADAGHLSRACAHDACDDAEDADKNSGNTDNELAHDLSGGSSFGLGNSLTTCGYGVNAGFDLSLGDGVFHEGSDTGFNLSLACFKLLKLCLAFSKLSLCCCESGLCLCELYFGSGELCLLKVAAGDLLHTRRAEPHLHRALPCRLRAVPLLP